jgi:hypothetical protein
MLGSVGQGAGVTIKLNPTTTNPSVAYFDRANNAVDYNACSGTPSACATSGWNATQIENTTGVSGLASGNEQLLNSTLGFDSSGSAWVFYPKGSGATGGLTLAEAPSGTSAFSIFPILAGANGNMSGMAALNFAVSGWNVGSVQNAAGSLTTVYVGPGNWLYSTSCGD